LLDNDLLKSTDLKKELEEQIRKTEIPELLADDGLIQMQAPPKEESDMPESFRPFV